MTTDSQEIIDSSFTQAALTDALLEQEITVNYVEIIETVIDSLDSNNTAMVNHSEASKGYLWKFQYGSAEVFVQLTGTTNEDNLTVWSTVLKLPAKNEAQLTRRLLEMNWLDTVEARFAIVQDQVVVMASRGVADMSASEVSRAITIVAMVADDHDDQLKAEYGQ
jgi:hypothetical protein